MSARHDPLIRIRCIPLPRKPSYSQYAAIILNDRPEGPPELSAGELDEFLYRLKRRCPSVNMTFYDGGILIKPSKLSRS